MAPQRVSNRYASLILIVFLLVALLVARTCRSKTEKGPPSNPQTTTATPVDPKGLNRHPAVINYSKHARCRMSCRHIDESEVKAILATGKINYRKSEIGDNAECRKKYAVEGNTRDNQKVRIIFAPCQAEVTVVTVIDLDREWSCDCN